MEEQHNICPWCLTEIVWDEEIGPEENCPHCENELSNYRTVSIGDDDYEEEMERSIPFKAKKEELAEEEDEEEEDESPKSSWNEKDEGYRRTSRSRLGIEEQLQQIVDTQDELPECPSCREYMIEMGRQKIEDQFKPTIHPSVGEPILKSPFEVIWYVCPSCFVTSSILSQQDREEMVQALSPKE